MLLGGRSGTVISTVSTLVVLGALVAIFLLAPGAQAFEHLFLSPQHMWQAFIGNPGQGYYSVGAAIWLTIRMFIVAEILILIFALLIALVRQSVHPALFPIRILGTGYVDFFRGVPLILVIFAIGLGVPVLNLPVVSSQSNTVYGVTALVLSYSAYVSEVYRAGLNSVHQSQVAAAWSLGLPHRQALRYVICRRRCGTSSRRCSTTSSASRRTLPWSASWAPSRPTRRPRSTASRCSTSPASPWPPSCS